MLRSQNYIFIEMLIRWWLALSQMYGIPLTASRVRTYLGIPLFHGRVGNTSFDPLLSTVRSRLSSWQSKLMSKAAWRLLIQTVSSVISNYTIQVMKLPATSVEQIERMHQTFYRDDSQAKQHMHAVVWDKICSPISHGGLGL